MIRDEDILSFPYEDGAWPDPFPFCCPFPLLDIIE